MRRSRRWTDSSEGERIVRLLIRLLINAIAVWLASHIVPGISPLNQLSSLVFVAAILGVVNALIKPLFEVITCPIELLTLGLFTLIVNALMLGLTAWIAQHVGIAFRIDGFLAAFLGALVISIVSWLLTRLV